MVTNQSTLTSVGTKTIEEIRKGGIDEQMKERIAQEKAWTAERKISKLEQRITELESVISRMEEPMESVWIPTKVMRDFRKMAFEKKQSVNDLAIQTIIYSIYDEVN
jgi:hypothetical protein